MFDFLGIAICGMVLLGILKPLILDQTVGSSGEGLEARKAEYIWQTEKDRLMDLVRENDLARLENRIDAEAHEEVAHQLSEEAEAVVDRLRQLRAHIFEPDEAHHRRIAFPITASGLIAVGVAAIGVNVVANVNDIDMTVSPHDMGQIATEIADPVDLLSPKPPMMGDGDTPDIEAMVARLEERVYRQVPTEDDIRMLLRSYRVLERGEDALVVLELASTQFPDNVAFKMMLLRGAIQQPDFEPNAELNAAVDDVIRLQPHLYEAHWYRGVLLAREGKLEAARDTLIWLRPRIAERTEAVRAVDALLAELSVRQD